MTRAQEMIAALDRALLRAGHDVVLQKSPAPSAAQTVVPADSITARGLLRNIGRGYASNEIAGNVAQGDKVIIISPSEIAASTWLGGASAPRNTKLPIKGVRAVIDGATYSVNSVEPFYVQNALVRIELQARGV